MSTVDQITIPSLEAGQRLRQPEFHARYHAMPARVRAELIGGVVFMPSPLGNPHGIVDAAVMLWLGTYKSRTPGIQVSHNVTTILDEDNEFQPDCWLRILPAKGGQTRDVGKYVGGCPELVVEVAASSRSIDLGSKLAEYERAGALEYVVFALDPDEVFWYVRQNDRLVRVDAGPDGLYHSRTFPGLWLDPVALFSDDGLALLAALDRGLATDEHAGFLAPLAAR
jgi:Uma2 family endonuclease